MSMPKDIEVVRTVHAVVEDTITDRCIVKTLWAYQSEAQEYADEEGLRVVEWAILKKKGGEKMSDEELPSPVEYIESELKKINTVVYRMTHTRVAHTEITDEELRDAITELLANDVILMAILRRTRLDIQVCAEDLIRRSGAEKGC